MGKSQGGLSRLIGMAAMAAAVAAVTKELRRPASERTWHGEVAGFVPYDFRAPTMDRVKERLWSPDDPRVFKPQVFGVGWTVNLGRLLSLAQDRLSESASTSRTPPPPPPTV
jgi:Family of unknown function (DUF5808)